MSRFTRRGFLASGAAAGVAGCTAGMPLSGAELDRRVEIAKNIMFTNIPGSRELYARSAGVVIFPQITEVGLIIGGSYGEGALQIAGATVGYYSVAAASFGVQAGAQAFSHVLFLMTSEVLSDFRRSKGWRAGVDAEVVLDTSGVSYGASTTTINRPAVALVFGQRGVIAGATVEGAKYSPLMR